MCGSRRTRTRIRTEAHGTRRMNSKCSPAAWGCPHPSAQSLGVSASFSSTLRAAPSTPHATSRTPRPASTRLREGPPRTPRRRPAARTRATCPRPRGRWWTRCAVRSLGRRRRCSSLRARRPALSPPRAHALPRPRRPHRARAPAALPPRTARGPRTRLKAASGLSSPPGAWRLCPRMRLRHTCLSNTPTWCSSRTRPLAPSASRSSRAFRSSRSASPT
mmetsp:Transcript_13542/g.36205  ORF Transcript_13542/g.36205 Transcript_13542/m.36205 type:complete len:219 (+) Transcript_13542:148-804(+)